MTFGYEVAEAIVEYYRIGIGCSNEDIDNAQIVLKEMYKLTHDKWFKRSMDECERYRDEAPDEL